MLQHLLAWAAFGARKAFLQGGKTKPSAEGSDQHAGRGGKRSLEEQTLIMTLQEQSTSK